MAEISAGLVKELREKTDAPMMECKKALTEAGGDLARAEEILRVKLGNRATKAATRATGEGVVAAYVAGDGRTGALVEVNCETDFVAKNAEFLIFAQSVAERVAAHDPADVAALSGLAANGGTVEEARRVLAGKIGENMTIRRFTRLEARGRLSRYVHGGARIGVLVDVVGGDDVLAKDIAMQVAAAKPVALSPSEIPAAIVERERSIAAAKAAESGKPAEIVKKMIEGAVQKSLKELALLEQPFVKNDKQSVGALLKARNASVAGFALFVMGEGIEKQA
ncbi:MAG: elongation factor Ts [Burkholderiales bacterium]|nr:elongation factor Ts [Burkholderiales bacterium]